MIENVLLGLGIWACICIIWFNTKDFYEGDRWWEFPIGATCFVVMIVSYFIIDMVSKWSNGK